MPLERLRGGVEGRVGFYRTVEPVQIQLLRRWDPFAMPGDEDLPVRQECGSLFSTGDIQTAGSCPGAGTSSEGAGHLDQPLKAGCLRRSGQREGCCQDA